jgi:hypothetical protein
MSSRDFCFWLMGYFEIHNAGLEDRKDVCHGLPSEKVKMIEKHLALVFKHEIDPSYGDEKHQKSIE